MVYWLNEKKKTKISIKIKSMKFIEFLFSFLDQTFISSFKCIFQLIDVCVCGFLFCRSPNLSNDLYIKLTLRLLFPISNCINTTLWVKQLNDFTCLQCKCMFLAKITKKHVFFFLLLNQTNYMKLDEFELLWCFGFTTNFSVFALLHLSAQPKTRGNCLTL